MSLLTQLRMLQLASPSLPVGGFTYSQGLEWAVEAGWVTDVASFKEWQQLQLEQVLIRLDIPILRRLYDAVLQQDITAFRHWSAELIAHRETAELRREEQQRGAAMLRVLDGLQIAPEQPEWRQSMGLSQLGGLSWAAGQWQLPVEQVMLIWSYGWLENAVMAGVKLVPFGQQAAQSLLADLSAELATRLPETATLGDEQVGGSLPLMAIASARHETQHTRLFRS
ncbi:urease accessory protein UreF [Carnimonas bestiolae]|uniref:urease accessory protein UreF n=1 Tax=Carnimonas bestiolae TaxID=3402172 RepID=UPI003EDB8018